MRRPRRPPEVPLTDEQSRLAAEHYELARGVAGKLLRGLHRRARTRNEDISDLAWAGLYYAVTSFDADRSPDFLGYLGFCIRRRRSYIVRTPVYVRAQRLPVVHVARPDELADARPGPHLAVIEADALDAALRPIVGRAALAFRLRAGLNMNKIEVGAALGVSDTHVGRLLGVARKAIETQLAAPGPDR